MEEARQPFHEAAGECLDYQPRARSYESLKGWLDDSISAIFGAESATGYQSLDCGVPTCASGYFRTNFIAQRPVPNVS